MEPKRKFKIIKKPKMLRLKTPEQIFKHLFHNQIDFDFLEKHSVTASTMVDFNGPKGKAIFDEGKQLLKDILKEYGISDIHTKTIEKTPKNTLGIININNIGNNKNIYFKHYTPNSYSLFYNILATVNPQMLTELKRDIYKEQMDLFAGTIQKNKDSILHFISNPIKDTISKSFTKIITNCQSISKWLNKNIVIFQDSISDSSFDEIINCTDSSVDTLDNDIIIIYVSYNKQFLFEPVIHINLDVKGKINYMIDNTPNQQTQRTYIYNLFKQVKEAQLTVKVPGSKKPLFKVSKPKQIDYIYFNPYDKNQELPIIEIMIDSSTKKSYLLGHEINGYSNIYDDSVVTNDLAGRIKFNSDDTIDADWCEGFPNK
jgi:hypothetical protein